MAGGKWCSKSILEWESSGSTGYFGFSICPCCLLYGQWGAVGGTSAASPIWAAGLVLVNQGLMKQIGKFTASPQMFYVVAYSPYGLQPYYDVTRGNNLYYPATPGWDYSSGLGTPNLWNFYMAL